MNINAIQNPAKDFWISPWSSNPHILILTAPSSSFNPVSQDSVKPQLSSDIIMYLNDTIRCLSGTEYKSRGKKQSDKIFFNTVQYEYISLCDCPVHNKSRRSFVKLMNWVESEWIRFKQGLKVWLWTKVTLCHHCWFHQYMWYIFKDFYRH